LDAHAVVANMLQISNHGVELRDCLNLPSTTSFFARLGRCIKTKACLSYSSSLVPGEQIEPC